MRSPVQKRNQAVLLAVFQAILLALFASPSVAGARNALGNEPPAELVTDRPDQTESAAVVGKGSTQIETGWLLTHSDRSGEETDTQEIPGTLVRIGVSRRVELRLGWAGQIDFESDVRGPTGRRSRSSGSGDASLGVKVRLVDERGRRPEIAVLAGTSLPVGSRDFSTHREDPSFRFSLAHTLSESVSLGYNLGLEWESTRQADGGFSTTSRGIYTVALGFGITDRLGAFVEVFGDVAASARGGPAHLADGGFTYLLRDNLQLDIAAGVGLNDRADDWFVGLGLTLRLPR